MHRRGQLYICAEYFAPVKAYQVIRPKPAAFVRPDTGSNNAAAATMLQLNDERRGVLNAGIGATYRIKGATTVFASLRTDFTYDKGIKKNGHTVTEGYKVNTTDWNLYHAQVGLSMRRKRYYVRGGLLLTYGSTGRYDQTINLDHPAESNFLLGEPKPAHARTLQAGALVSYIHNF